MFQRFLRQPPDVVRVVISRWRLRPRKTPFGQPFKYTDPYDLKTPYDTSKPWYKKLRRKKPIAWVVVDHDEVPIPQAHLMNGGEVRISPIQVRSIFPVYDENLIVAAEEYEESQGEEAHF